MPQASLGWAFFGGTRLPRIPGPTLSSFQRFNPLSQASQTDRDPGGGAFADQFPSGLGSTICSSALGKSRGKSKQVWTHQEQMGREE